MSLVKEGGANGKEFIMEPQYNKPKEWGVEPLYNERSEGGMYVRAKRAKNFGFTARDNELARHWVQDCLGQLFKLRILETHDELTIFANTLVSYTQYDL